MRGRMIHHKHKHTGSSRKSGENKETKEEVEVEVRREAQAYDPKGGEVSFWIGF
jgi:hypothetical protein